MVAEEGNKGLHSQIKGRKLAGIAIIEILLAVTILSILAIVIIAALNPKGRLQDSRNSQRWNDVNVLLTALHNCVNDNDFTTCGVKNDDITREIVDGETTTGCNNVCLKVASASGCANLKVLMTGVGGKNTTYLDNLPRDPNPTEENHTSYSITAKNGIVTIAACAAEGGQPIAVSR